MIKNFFQKALQRGLTPSNIISFCCLEAMRFWGVSLGTFCLRCKAALLGIELGKNVRAHGSVGLLRWPGGKISIGDNVSLISSWRRATACTVYAPVRLRVFGVGASIEIGQGTQMSGTSITARSQKISIGQNVMFGPNCIVVDSDFHAPWPAEERINTPGIENDAPVIIEDYVWLGMNTLILKGVHIGRGTLVGAGSVVTRSLPENCLAVGTPARVIKTFPNPSTEKA